MRFPHPRLIVLQSPDVIVNDQKPVDYQAPRQFNLRAKGEEVEWQSV